MVRGAWMLDWGVEVENWIYSIFRCPTSTPASTCHAPTSDPITETRSKNKTSFKNV